MNTSYRHLVTLNELQLAKLPLLASQVTEQDYLDVLLFKHRHHHMAASYFIPLMSKIAFGPCWGARGCKALYSSCISLQLHKQSLLQELQN